MAENKRIALAAFGTLGDVFPIVGLTGRLAEHCDVIVVTSAPYAKYFGKTRVRVVEALSPRQHADAMDEVRLSTTRGVRSYLTSYLVASLPASIGELLELDRTDPVDAFLGTGFINAAQWAAEILGKPYIRISLSPFADKEVILSELATRNGKSRPARMLVSRTMMKLACLYHHYSFVNRFLNPVRRSFRLAKYGVTDVMTRPYAAQRVALYPESLLQAAVDDRPPITFTGFPLSDPCDEDVALRTRGALDRCARKPLVFVAGSGDAEILRDVQYAYSLCSQLCMPGIFVHSKIDRLGKRAFSNLTLLDFADLSLLLPRALLVVHHGGIGTIAQSLRAGIPQLVRPLAFDQFDNARRMARLSVGAFLPAEQRYDVSLSARLVSYLTSNPDISSATARHRAEIARSNGLKDAAGSILRFLERSTADGRQLLC